MELIPRERLEVAPGAVHVPDWLAVDEQRRLVEACREWAAGRRRCATPAAQWRHDVGPDGLPGLALAALSLLAHRRALAAAFGEPAPDYDPDVALVNFYDDAAKMGLHQDKEERSAAPVVSLSIGDSCVFRFGNTETRGKPYTDVELRSGDLFVFGGPARFAYHGVPKVLPGTADPACGMESGRLNLTLRVTGLEDG